MEPGIGRAASTMLPTPPRITLYSFGAALPTFAISLPNMLPELIVHSWPTGGQNLKIQIDRLGQQHTNGVMPKFLPVSPGDDEDGVSG